MDEVMKFLAFAVVIFLGIGLHEYAHCKAADMAGDPTPSMYGRVTLNLFKHFELVGTIFMVITYFSGFGLGWGKPAPMDPRKMKHPKWDHLVAVAAGPVSNLVQATLFAVIFRILMSSQIVIGPEFAFFRYLVTFGVIVNISLFLFNLIPIGMLDGHWIVGILLPPTVAVGWYQFQRSYGFFVLLFLIFSDQYFNSSGMMGPLDYLLVIPAKYLTTLLTGVPY